MEIRPFRGWRYRLDGQEDLGRLIAPPYDILSAADKAALLAGSPHNIVAVDMPHVPPKDVGPESEYRAAAGLLAQWRDEGVLVQDPKPALYAYEQTFAWGGRTYHRRALLCGVRATPLGKDVIPHERTFAGPKADRLALTWHTRMQLSPIFGFYDDGGAAGRSLWSATTDKPAAQGELAGVQEKLWVIDDPATIEHVSAALRSVPVFIADGHHRYTTALNYLDQLRAKESIGPDRQANFVLFALVERQDSGLLILPTHRTVRGLAEGFTLGQLRQAAPEFDWASGGSPADLSDADGFLRPRGPTAMAFVGAGGDEIWIATLRDRLAMEQAAPDELPAWRELDVAILHKLIIDKALAPWRTGRTAIEYTPQAPQVIEACRGGSAQLGICLQATPLEAVGKIALAGGVMPHKSTYFYPKLATGMVLKPLD